MNLNAIGDQRTSDRASSKRVRSCLRSLLVSQPFFGSIALKMPVVENSRVQSIAGNGSYFEYNPQWVKDKKSDDIKAALLRIVVACSLKHHTRRGDRHFECWQEASYYACSPFIKDCGFEVDVDEDYKNETVESIYRVLYSRYQQKDDQGSGNMPGGQGCNSPGGNDPNSGGQNPGSGSGNDGDDGDSPLPPGLADKGVVSDSANQDLKDEERKWDENVAFGDFTERSSGEVGNVSGKLKEVLYGTDSSMDWRELLVRFMREQREQDYTWSRPNRRYIDSGIYMPSLERQHEGAGKVVFAIDTSGSMSSPMLRQVWGEIREAVKQVKPENVIVIQCDSMIKSVKEYDVWEMPEELHALGRGGTEFNPVFRYVEEEMAEPPECLIYFTDLEVHPSDYPDASPFYPVLWCWQVCEWSAEQYGNMAQPPENEMPPFGEVIRVGE